MAAAAAPMMPHRKKREGLLEPPRLLWAAAMPPMIPHQKKREGLLEPPRFLLEAAEFAQAATVSVAEAAALAASSLVESAALAAPVTSTVSLAAPLQRFLR